VRALAREASGASIGGAAEWIEIPDLAARKLTASSVFLSSSPAAADALRDAQMARRFKRGDTLHFQVYVYNPAVDAGASDVVLQAQLRSADKLIGASKPEPVAFQEKDGAPLPYTNSMSLAGMTPGLYQLRVVVVDRKANVNAVRNVDFTLE
jgi:hypothetical protein